MLGSVLGPADDEDEIPTADLPFVGTLSADASVLDAVRAFAGSGSEIAVVADEPPRAIDARAVIRTVVRLIGQVSDAAVPTSGTALTTDG